MAKGAVIGALRVVLGADTAQFEKGMKQAQSRLSGFSSGMAKAAAGVAAAMAGMGAAFGVAVRGMLDDADKLSKLSQSIGVPIERLSALKYAAEQSGAQIDHLARLFRNFARNAQGAAASGAGAFSQALDSIGVAWRDAEGNFRRADEVMLDVADKFARMQDGAGKTALAMKIFGEEMGPKFIPMLNLGSEGIRQLTDEARQLGLVIDQQTGAAAERFSTALTVLGRVKDGIVTTITARLAPTFAMLAERMADAAKNSNAMKYAGDLLAMSLKGLLSAGTIVMAIFRELGRVVAAVAGAVVAIAQGEFSAAANLVKQHWSNAKEAVAGDMQFIRDLWAETTAQTAVATQQFQELTAAPVVQSTRAMADEMRAFHEAARNALWEIINSPTETFTEKMAAVEEAVRNGTISFQQFGQLTKRIQQENINQWHDLASNVASSLTTIFGKSKAASIAAAVINTAQAITKNLSAYPWPISAAMAALAAASGAAQIATIKSTNIGGGGKTPSVRGGSGGGTEPQQQALPSQTISVQGISPTQLFSGEAMRGLMEELLQRQRDGAHVVLA